MKTFLSIGSGPGIGIATAERFAKEGFRVVLTSRDVAKLGERVAELKDKGYIVAAKSADAGDLASISALIKETESEFGSVDVLHFNSASMHSATIETQQAETFVPDLTINIGAALVAVQDVSRGMLKRGEGSILLTGGIFGVTPHPDYLSLSIGKAGMRALTLGTFDNFRDRGVHIATVTVGALIAAGSAEATAIAEAFWNLHAQPKDSWAVEVNYPA
ncbi:SDR family NAD(P)-dependent oxidoreductase [Agrobacterium sp. Ap1]|uniref:SDR family NAD(P)-dependent oxidoreductase n=1 Tax=Agrobacterium sp. Ap1 TaxID=2815337 RepID=UPI001A8F357A|nr:SDR family NAD(P)-dependent oxidoreductase [Agrobacterium sp. Ap1]MBO0144641.1 SDR family NAD(P)-dependent oxidoreductase [Agrobacterium sp. Ap1]